MFTDTHIEILAQALWLRYSGVTYIMKDWQDWAKKHNSDAKKLRDQASVMLNEHDNRGKGVHTSIGWIYR